MLPLSLSLSLPLSLSVCATRCLRAHHRLLVNGRAYGREDTLFCLVSEEPGLSAAATCLVGDRRCASRAEEQPTQQSLCFCRGSNSARCAVLKAAEHSLLSLGVAFAVGNQLCAPVFSLINSPTIALLIPVVVARSKANAKVELGAFEASH